MTTLLILLLPLWSFASGVLLENGGSSFGNGGHSVRCFVPETGNWSNPESLDLYEGRRELLHQHPQISSESEAETLALTLARKIDLASSFDDLTGMRFGRNYGLTAKLRYILRNRVFVDSALTPTNDSKFQGLSSNCELVQTINFGNEILVNRPLWEAHSAVDKSALLLHETIYWHLRSQGRETDSRRVRRLVSHLISGRELAKVIDPALKEKDTTQLCRSKSLDIKKASELYAAVTPEGRLALYFRKLGNFRMLAQTVLGGPEIRTTLPFDRENLTFEGEIQSVLDKNSHFEISWNADRQELTIRGQFENDYPIQEVLDCQSLKRH